MLSPLSRRPGLDPTKGDLETPRRRSPDWGVELDPGDLPDGSALTHDRPILVGRDLDGVQFSRERDRADLARHCLDIPSVVCRPFLELLARRIGEVSRGAPTHH